MPKSRNKLLILIAVGIVIVLGLVYLGIQNAPMSEVLEPGGMTVSKQITLQGKTACLPNRNNEEVQTLECVLGIETKDKSYYALDVSQITEKKLYSDLPTGSSIKVIGLYIPIEEIQSDRWEKYDIRGIMRVEKFEKQ